MTTNIERDSENKTAPPPAKAKRRWFAFSLRTLLIATALLSCVLGYFGNILLRVRHQRAVIAKIEAAGGQVIRAAQQFAPEAAWPGHALVRWMVGEDAFAEPVAVLGSSHLNDDELPLLLDFPKLPGLSLSGQQVTDRGMATVAQLRHLTALELNDTKVTGEGIKKLAVLPSLQVLSIGSERSFYEESADESNQDELLQGIGELRNLEHLHLLPSSVTSNGLSHLQPLSNLKRLEIVRATRLTDDGLHYLQGMKSLKFLTLAQCSIQGDGFAHLSDLPQLSILILGGNPVTDEGLVHIAKCKNLKILDLSGTQVSDRGLAYLATPPGATTGESFGSAQKLVRLERLIVGPAVSKEVALAFQRSRPTCKVTLDGNTLEDLFEP